jgi:large subunit ribosomal protein L6
MAKAYGPLPILPGVEVKAGPGKVSVKGKLGVLELSVRSGIAVKADGKHVVVTADPGVARADVGSLRAHLGNMMRGVVSGYSRTVELRGMGYRAQKTKDGLQITCGFSHPVAIPAPAGISYEVTQVPNPDDTKEQMFEMTVKGIDKHLVGHMAATIRALKPPDPYHGKGLRYRGEYVRKKAGKRAVATQT